MTMPRKMTRASRALSVLVIGLERGFSLTGPAWQNAGPLSTPSAR